MKIATYNVSNINKSFAPVAPWLKQGKPDVVCLQELKVCSLRGTAVRDLYVAALLRQ